MAWAQIEAHRDFGGWHSPVVGLVLAVHVVAGDRTMKWDGVYPVTDDLYASLCEPFEGSWEDLVWCATPSVPWEALGE